MKKVILAGLIAGAIIGLAWLIWQVLPVCKRSHREQVYVPERAQFECMFMPGVPYFGGKQCGPMIYVTKPAHYESQTFCDEWEKK
jgi:hypothetical protein